MRLLSDSSNCRGIHIIKRAAELTCILQTRMSGQTSGLPNRTFSFRACLRNPLPLLLWRRGLGRGGHFFTSALHCLAIFRHTLILSSGGFEPDFYFPSLRCPVS